jgi:hypothetical protein
MRLAVAIGFAALQAILATTSLAKTSIVHHRRRPQTLPCWEWVEASCETPVGVSQWCPSVGFFRVLGFTIKYYLWHGANGFGAVSNLGSGRARGTL